MSFSIQAHLRLDAQDVSETQSEEKEESSSRVQTPGTKRTRRTTHVHGVQSHSPNLGSYFSITFVEKTPSFSEKKSRFPVPRQKYFQYIVKLLVLQKIKFIVPGIF